MTGRPHNQKAGPQDTTRSAAQTESPEGKTAAVRAGKLLLEKLASGNFLGGEPLRESQLAAEFGVGRIAAREALSRAVGWGIAEYLPFKGWRVRDFSLGDLLDWCRMREGLEPVAARELARKRPQLVLRQLADAVAAETSAAAAGDPDGVIRADLVFHLAMMSGCGNRCFASPAVSAYFPVVFNLALRPVAELNYRDGFPLRRPRPRESFTCYLLRNSGDVRGHADLLALIGAGRDADAERLLRTALRKTGDEVEAMIEFYDFDRTTPIRRLKRRNTAGADAL